MNSSVRFMSSVWISIVVEVSGDVQRRMLKLYFLG